MSAPDPAGLVIFDCDGVLVDSERLTVEIEARFLAEIGWPLTAEEIVERFLGRTEDDMVAAIEDQIGQPVPDEWRARWLAETQSALDSSLTAVPGVADAITTLVAEGYEVCVGSSGRPEKIARNLRTTGLIQHFEPVNGRVNPVFSALHVERGKPAPDLFLLAAETMGFAPADSIVIEDSAFGVEAAHAAGMRAIGYAGSLTPAAALGDADVVLDDMADLPDAVARLSAQR